MSARDVLASWLNNAYAMETALIPILEDHAKDAREHPAMQARIEEHAAETRRQAELVKGCIERMGASVSTTKKTLGSLFGMVQAPATSLADDELVKNMMMDFAAENFEIAAYEALVAAAQHCDEPAIATVCMEILEQEKRMAQWLHDHLGTVAENYCQRAAGVPLRR